MGENDNIIDSKNRPRKYLTLVFVINGTNKEVLLGMKKRGFGCGRWNGFGGKVQSNESIEECAKRETLEECGLEMLGFFKIANIEFEFVGDPVLLDVTVFRCDSYSGDVAESEEMRPKWFRFDEVPFKEMWPDDYLWYKHIFNNQRFSASFLFEGHDNILNHSIELL